MKRVSLVAAVLAFLVTPVAAAQDANGGPRTVELDLAGGDATHLVDPGQVDLVAVHALPDVSYTVRVERRSGALLQAFELAKFELAKVGERESSSKDCEQEIASLEAQRTESELRAAIGKLRFSRPACNGDINRWVDERSLRPVQGSPFTLAANEALIVEIERYERSWTFEVTTGGERRWLVHYGFS